MDNSDILCRFVRSYPLSTTSEVISWIGDQVESAISYFTPDYQFVAALVIILWVSAIASAFIDNIPYTITMIPVVLQMGSLSLNWAL